MSSGARRLGGQAGRATRRPRPGSTSTGRSAATSATSTCTSTAGCRAAPSPDLTDGEDPKAQIKLAVGSDDLLALVAGRLHFASAWAGGRVSVKASFGDLLKLRKLL